MPNRPLAPVLLNGRPVGLGGEPRPSVSQVLAASGRAPAQVEVRRLSSPFDLQGDPVALDDVIDRTLRATDAVYLLCVGLGPPTRRGNTRVPPAKSR